MFHPLLHWPKDVRYPKIFQLFEDSLLEEHEASAAAGAAVPRPSLLEGNVQLMSLINPWLRSLKTELGVPSLSSFLWVLAPAPMVCPYIYGMAGCVLRQSIGVPCPS